MLTADDVLAAVRVHADRMHDAVRRLGCTPMAAAHVVESASMELVDAVARGRQDVEDPVGWLFARARALGRQAAGGDDELPVGGGVLSSDATQLRLAEALESRPERERTALLLRDSYDLPMAAVATALELDVPAAAEAVGAARLALLPALTATSSPAVPDHVPRASLTRLAEGGQHAARETTTRRHAESCERCAAVVDAQERARRLLSGLSVVALPDAEREQLLARVQARAWAVLPRASAEPEQEWEEEPHRRYSLSLMGLGVLAALGAGIGIGVLTSRGGSDHEVAQQRPVALVTAAPVITVVPAQLGTPPPSTPPSPRVFYITPSPTPEPTLSPTPTPTQSALPAVLQLDPSSGPRNSSVTVTGSGFSPTSQVTVQYYDAGGIQVGYTATVVTDTAGTFTTTIQAHDSSLANPAGPHQVTASDGVHEAQATFTAT